MKSPEKMHTVREDYVQKMRESYLLIMLTIMHDIVVSVDKDGKLIFVNDAGIEFLNTFLVLKASHLRVCAENVFPKDTG